MKVLISPGFGAGWSTWNDPRMAFDKVLIEAVERGISARDMELLCVKRGYTDEFGNAPYMSGFETLVVKEVPSGSIFQIKEYDGNEYIEYFEEEDWYISIGEYYDIN